ncbi:MAG: MATE family efflux transporter [Chloroflexi bacterium]|nr:MATE family efflux transporter [Chloroflexota bacterium]
MHKFFDDKDFFSTFFRLWMPIASQQLIFALLNFVSTMMVGQLGETSVAAFSLANQIIFLLQLFMFGIGSGAAIFVAQFWGKRDVPNIRRVLGISLIIGLAGAGIFSIIALVFPAQTLAIYSSDPAVIALGSDFLRIVGLGYLAVPITNSFTVALRSTGNVRAPVVLSIISWSLCAVMNYALIFGQFGMPALGIHGSAIASTIARGLECVSLVAFAYLTHSVAAARPRELLAFDRPFILSVIKTMLPVVVNEILWSTGISLYSLIYGRIGTESVAAVSIAASVENLAFVPFIAVANSAAIMIGNRIGADEEHKAMTYAKQFLTMNLVISTLLGAIIFFSADLILRFYQIDAITHEYARNVLTIMAFALIIKASNMLIIVGVLRAGGDSRVSALIDVSPLWLVGLPAAALGAFVFGWPVYWVYLLTITDEACKLTLALWRMISKRWINNLAQQHPVTEP